MSKTLVTYFSPTGTTKKQAEKIAKAANAELVEIIPVEAYTSADLNWNNKSSRSNKEMQDDSARPAIANKIDDIDEYDTIFIGFPIWWHTYPRIIETFLDTYDLSGKTIVPFATSGGSGTDKAVKSLKEKLPNSTIKDGRTLNNNPDDTIVEEWVSTVI